ncbi:hypothetical protein EVJ58_g9614 [Rhodofomes roseus]|uniref:FAD dependent oxidoreductase domain-containing protein n=1 Tax=Rhodofomes roseus TaxID=34475 RepID=A0A4Y9XTQ1_9APHY|nr:hypothetical protein EVJ58_g9614 [Rhodofomes roseus]
MGNLASKVKLYIAATAQLKETFDLLNKRIETPPGIPVPNPTLPFWTVPASAILTEDEPLADSVDIVIVGSGITGTSVAYTLLSNGSKARILMLEARAVCSGATGRNGGHINPPLYHDYSELQENFGEDAAKRMIRFRLAHRGEMQRIAETEDIVKQSQTYAEAKENLRKWKSAMPDESTTHTPCTAIVAASADKPYYVVETPRGSITAQHVIHATNGWCSHLLEPLRAKVIPARGVMSAQRPGTLLRNSTLDGYRSFVFYRGTSGYDYLTQLPTGEHELMYGGGWAQSCENSLPDIGITDDSVFNFAGAAHLAGSLPLYFGGDNWGGEAVPAKEQEQENRPAPTSRHAPEKGGPSAVSHLAAPGEWLAAGFSGEGMVHAWMSGKALAYMVLDQEDALEGWFPDILRVTEKRWKKASADKLVGRFL